MPEQLLPGVVTIGIPVYRRLHCLPRALESLAAQDYARIDLLVSDNGGNGDKLREIVERHYPGSYRLRRNAETVDICRHYNQLVENAAGEYFLLLCDDDELGPGSVTALVAALNGQPEVAVALPRLEVMDETGETVHRSRGAAPPRRMTATEFIRVWCSREYSFVCFATNLARTAEILAAGGYPQMPKGTATDDGLLLKLSLGRGVAFVPEATFRYRVFESSHGLALPYWELARDLKAFLRFLDSDPVLAEFARRRPGEWAEARRLLVALTWRTYRARWRKLYRGRLSKRDWIRAAFAMPFIPAYYVSVLSTLLRKGLLAPRRLLRRGATSRRTPELEGGQPEL